MCRPYRSPGPRAPPGPTSVDSRSACGQRGAGHRAIGLRFPACPQPSPSPSRPWCPATRWRRCSGGAGQGEVWRAIPRRGGPPVAVKVLVDGDPDRQAREAALLGELDHPHLVRLIEVVHQPQRGGAARVALVLDLLDGGSLAALLARRGRLRPGEVVTTIAPVAAALAHAHEQRRRPRRPVAGQHRLHRRGAPGAHRPRGGPGARRDRGRRRSPRPTSTRPWPAAVRPGPASDVFGVAAAAFHALTGIAPWNAATPADTLTVAAARATARPGRAGAGRRRRSCSPSSAAGCPPTRTTAGSAAAFALDLRHACRPEPVRLPGERRARRRPRAHRSRPAHRAHPPGAGPSSAACAGGGRSCAGRTLGGPAWPPRPALRLAGRSHRRARRRRGRTDRGRLGRGALGRADRRGSRPRWLQRRPAASTRTSVAPTAAPRGRRRRRRRPTARSRPGRPADWADLVAELYTRRAAAFAAASPDALGDVYADGSPAAGRRRGATSGSSPVRGRCCAASRPRSCGWTTVTAERAAAWSWCSPTAGTATRWWPPTTRTGRRCARSPVAASRPCAWC